MHYAYNNDTHTKTHTQTQTHTQGLPKWFRGEESAFKAVDEGSIPGSGRSPGRGNATPVLLPGKSYGQRNLAGYTVLGVEKSQTLLKRLSMHTCMHTHKWGPFSTAFLYLITDFDYLPGLFERLQVHRSY